MHRSEVKNSEEWNRSIGKKGLSLTCDHYRKGRKHAVFPKNEDWGKIHEDREAAHIKPLGHLLKDAPEVLATGALIAGSIISLKFRKKK